MEWSHVHASIGQCHSYRFLLGSLFYHNCFIRAMHSFGQGGYNPSLQAFGADQLHIEDDVDSGSVKEKDRVKSLFFQWWYFAICCGSLLGNSIMSYIKDTVGWGLGFAIPCGVMIISVVGFLCGTPLYTRKGLKTGNKPSEGIFKVPKAVVKKLVPQEVHLPSSDDDSNITELELQEKTLIDEFTDLTEVHLHEATPNVTKTILDFCRSGRCC